MSITIGSRVRAVIDLYRNTPAGSTGVVADIDYDTLPYYVHFDNDEYHWCVLDEIEEYTPVFASHYQAQPIMDEPASATDDAGPTPDTPLSGEELMNITRSFCR